MCNAEDVCNKLFFNIQQQIEQIFQKSCTLQKIITIIVQFFFCTQLLQYLNCHL